MTECEPSEPIEPTPLPPELAEFLRQYSYAALLHATSIGTVLVATAPRSEIDSIRGRVPIRTNHQLFDLPISPVVRLVTRIYDQPERPLALETFVNVGDPDQRADYEALTHQDELVMFFYDEHRRHALSKRIRGLDQAGMQKVLATADQLLSAVPVARRNFDLAKAEVIRHTNL